MIAFISFSHSKATPLLPRILFAIVFVAIGITGIARANELTPAGIPRNQSIYITMRDGVNIAVDVWVPATLKPGEQVPAILKMTSYWRAIGLAERTGAFRVLGAVGMVPTEDMNKPEADAYCAGGYAMVYVDARGSGASYGKRPYPFTEDELNDYKEIVDWIIAQPWSNGKVGAMGVAYEGTAAELLTTRAHPAVQAVAPMFSDFDPWSHLVSPGGVLNEWFIGFWRDGTRMLDNNDLDALAKFKGHDVDTLKRVITGVKRVAADSSGALLTAALLTRKENADVYAAARRAEFRDDPFGSGPSFKTFSAYGMKDAIERAGTPTYVWVGWLDAATVSGALSRFTTFNTPQRVVIGPWGHAGRFDANPFAAPDVQPQPSKEARDQQLMQYFDGYLKDNAAAPAREIRYYTMGENKWKTTDTWPPAGIAPRTLYFGSSNALDSIAPATPEGSDTYTVDFDASTGTQNRWRTQAQGEDVIYADRAAQSEGLLTYTSAPLESNLEITGSPVVTLFVSTTETDGAVFAYFERVDHTGTVTYITEGMLRLCNRAVSTASTDYNTFAPHHSFARADALPVTPGETMECAIELIPTSVLLRKGDRIRVSIAGHDASCFARYPAKGNPVLTIQRNARQASHITLPTQNQ